MVGSKPNAYLTEEARLEAQRRMLAERYGLLSDDSDDGEEQTHPPNGLPTQNGQPPPPAANGGDAHPSPPDDPAPSEAATYGEGSSVHDSDLTFVMSQDENYNDHVPSSEAKPALADKAAPDGDRPSGWPGVEITDSSNGNKICATYEYKSTTSKDASPRDLRVTQITVYASQFLERHERKIAVNDHIITYAVGGHIRAILRNSTVRSLLKGHDSSVADIEFLSTSENKLESSLGDNISILGSVADDGSVYVWKIVRNDAGKQDTLEVADAIRFEHPDCEKGRSYRRIAFRPGPNSIIAENGIGVAMLLLDGEATDLRVVEVVKMNDKMMVRDKFLKARNEIVDKGEKADGPIDAAAWLSERVVATSRGGNVFLWNADSTFSSCIAKIPRNKQTKVTGLHALSHEALLLVVEAGRELEVWVASDLSPDMRTTSLTLRQTVRLFPERTQDVFCVASVDPAEELVMISNIKGSSFFAIHYNSSAQAFDTITEVPLKHPILSFCITRNDKKASSSNVQSSMINAEPTEELGIWCVQPRGIQLIHLPAKDCGPRGTVVSEVHPKPIPKTVTRKVEKMPPTLMSQSLPSTSAASVKSKEHTQPVSHLPSASKRIPRSLGNIKTRAASPPQTRTPPAESTNKSAKSAEPPASVEAVSRSSAISDMPNKPPSAPPSHGTTTPNKHGPTTDASPPPAEPSPSADDVADAILNAAKKAITAFEEGANQRSVNEKAKMDRLIESVSETAEANLERFVNKSMKKVLSETMLPGITKIISEYRAAMKESAKANTSITQEHFERVIESSGINASFSNACKEMTRQVSGAVTQSMTSKYDSLIKPTIEIVNDAAEDLSASVSQLRKEVSKLELGDAGGRPDIVEIEPEDTRRSIEEQIAQGNVDSAFLTALDKEDLELVTWLCKKFDSSSFFETYKLSQVAMLSLAQQLGHGLSGEDVEFKVDWLRELMLVLDPESEDIASLSLQFVQGLVDNVNELKKNKALVDQHDGLEKKLKTLGRLVASHIPK